MKKLLEHKGKCLRKGCMDAILHVAALLISFLPSAHNAKYIWTTLEYPGGSQTEAWGINNAGQIVGSYIDGDNQTHGFLYDGLTSKTLGQPSGSSSVIAHRINEAGQIVGKYWGSDRQYGFVATPVPDGTPDPTKMAYQTPTIIVHVSSILTNRTAIAME